MGTPLPCLAHEAVAFRFEVVGRARIVDEAADQGLVWPLGHFTLCGLYQLGANTSFM